MAMFNNQLKKFLKCRSGHRPVRLGLECIITRGGDREQPDPQGLLQAHPGLDGPSSPPSCMSPVRDLISFQNYRKSQWADFEWLVISQLNKLMAMLS